ncbi:MAG TPA: VWA domain-containing protein [Polyangiaceae bacterium]|nr:VWA domain-containing protein [Polyangiaceae bacterium]
MRFADAIWLWGTGLSLVVAALLALGGVRLARARQRFADPARIDELLTRPTALRRTIKAILTCLAVALCFVAAAKPQYGHGTRVLPATNLDVVLVLDYSKSMYARDVSPSRIERAKIEVARLVKKLGGARLGAVAYAGEPMSFPLTSDGPAIAQFFRGLDPRDMPVGGTASALALTAGQELFARDPRSAQHEKVMILVTDGEDLEGDPVEAAREAKKAGIRVEVIQIGGRSPEPIPEMDERGVVVGMRKDADGNMLTTSLSAQGEAQLRSVAEAGGGRLHEAAQGEVGVDAMGDELRRLMKEELSERVETVYADVFQYPLGLAVVLLVLEAFIGASKVHRRTSEPPRGARAKRIPKRLRATAVLLVLSTLGCEPVDRLFERESPLVNEAIAALERGERDAATELLTNYLETGRCEAGVLGVGERAQKYGDASFDLALALGGAKEAGASGTAGPGGLTLPPGLAPPTAPGQTVPGQSAPGHNAPGQSGSGQAPAGAKESIECSLRLLGPIAEQTLHPAELRARALYLMGNLESSREDYRAAVRAYDRGLLLAPGLPAEGPGDPIGRQLAHNRAFALRRALEKEKKEQEEKDKQDEQQNSSQDPSQGDKDQKDQPDPNQQDQQKPDDQQGDQQKPDSKDGDQKDQKPDSKDGDQKDQQPDAKDGDQKGDPKEQPGQQSDKQDGQAPQPSGNQADGAPQQGQPGPSVSQDDRILDLLEQAPTLQQDQAKKHAVGRIGRSTMEDK